MSATNRPNLSMPQRQIFRSPWAILLAYAVLTILYTHPLAVRVGAVLPGTAPDTYLYIWNMEWLRTALLDLQTNPFYTQAIYFPTGVSLYFHTLHIGTSLLALPLILAFGLVPTYTVTALAMFILSGYAAYLLSYDLVQHRGAAFFAGLAFTFAPYHLSHLAYSHWNLLAIQWLPLLALALKKLLDRPGWRRLALALVLLVWIALTEWYYALYAVLFAGLYVLYRAILSRSLRPFGPALALGALFVLVLSPVFIGMAQELGEGNLHTRALEQADRFSADLLAFVTPSTANPIWGEAVRPLADSFHGGFAERSVFWGYTPLLLALVGIFRRRERERFFWLGAILVFAVLSLGPVLHVAGVVVEGPGGEALSLPSAILYDLPLTSTIMGAARSLSRYSLISLMGVAVLAAYGLAELARGRRGPLWVSLACLAVAVEFLVQPIPTTPVEVPPGVEILRGEPGNAAVLDLPLEFRTGGLAMYYSTIHHRATANGYHSQLFPLPLRLERLAWLGASGSALRDDILAHPPSAAAALQALDIGFVTLHKQDQDPDAYARSAEWVEQAFGSLTPLDRDPRMTLWRVPEVNPAPAVVFFDRGWHEPEREGEGRVWRWTDTQADVQVFTPAAQTFTLRFEAISYNQPRRLRVLLDGQEVLGRRIADNSITPVESKALALSAGRHQIRLYTLEPAEQPSVVEGSEDTRFLSLRVSRFDLEPQVPPR